MQQIVPVQQVLPKSPAAVGQGVAVHPPGAGIGIEGRFATVPFLGDDIDDTADGTAAVSFYTAEDGTRRSANRDVTEKTAALADEIAALTLTACVDYDPAEGAAAVCGLDTPEVTLTVNYLADNSAERTLILAVGLSTGDGGRYVALDGDTTIYRMEESSLTQILTLSGTGL